ncbi:GNAT family N-acetyltransferase [Facklamia sp. 7083-14-GEN3]|uniref:GNAT family N-acetyltransferase n=1 Tax=Facklamia sp. 7083-14-GEN3 TaxID=2973478 RepID=UPI00215CBBAA|nr:GNAT family N-acetyltransferase [Facklamia sp. 7083-14-GEN3]MCR8969678.1 N-acetyltransferase [Facklamia sp. 7083-14-GEN3]
MEFLKEDHAVVLRDEQGEMVAEITYRDTDDDRLVVANHTYTSDRLRGQGIAGKLLDELVAHIKDQGKIIYPSCPFVVRKFDEEPEKYGHIDARKAQL